MSIPRSIGLPAVLLAATLLPDPVFAFASFGGTAITSLTLTGVGGGQTLPTGVSVSYATAVEDSFAETQGRGAKASSESVLKPLSDVGLIAMPFDTPLGQANSVSGWAGDGEANARMLTDGYIFLSNGTGAAVTFNFSYAFYAALEAAADPFGIEARVDVNWLIDTLAGLGDPGPISISDYADPTTGTREWTASGSFSVTLGAREDDTLIGALDTWGFAAAPEPPVWVLLAVGLVAASARRRGGRRA